MRVRTLRQAEAEARKAASWYEQQQSGLGEDFLNELAESLESIEQDPLRFARLETLPSVENVHRCLLHRFPYSVVYQFRRDEAWVIAVAHVRRRPNYWKARLES